MAQRTIVTYTDDLDGSDANDTVKFSLDGTDFEIDLSDTNEQKLRDALAPFVGAGRKVKAKRGRKSTGGSETVAKAAGGSETKKSGSGNSATAAKRAHNQAVRTWARENGWDVPNRGRVAKEIVEAYEVAHPQLAEVEAAPVEPELEDAVA